jgi:IS30 family transposase
MAHRHLNDQERFYIEQRLAYGDSIPQIAKTLGRHKASLYKEIKRNIDKSVGFYSYLRARNIATDRKQKTVRRVKHINALDKITKDLIDEFLKKRMSPEQISGLLRKELQL